MDLSLLLLVFSLIFTVVSRLLHLYSTIDKTSRLPTESYSVRLFYTSVSLLLSRIQGYHYHLSKVHIYALVYCIGPGREGPLEKEMATHSSVLAWRIPGTGEPGGPPSMGSHKVGHD